VEHESGKFITTLRSTPLGIRSMTSAARMNALGKDLSNWMPLKKVYDDDMRQRGGGS